MNIKPYDKTIRDLLQSKRQFVIPRFQREYSWGKKYTKEFLEDMIENLIIKDGKISYNQYFLGTMLFIGNFTEGTESEIKVIDGQQRLTTITILFSAMSEVLKEIGQRELSQLLFKYIMTEDDDGNEVRILKSNSNYPYFAYYIQDINKSVIQSPTTEEEQCIKDSYEYFISSLSEGKIKNTLKKTNGSDVVDALSHIEILKALRDQVLNTTFISISTTDESQANKIFEILNAKGKKLAYIDLIKNKIFETLSDTEPADLAEETWKQLKNILYSQKEQVGLATFYRHYWISKYKKSSENKLYDDFLTLKISNNKERCKEFLLDLVKNAKIYMKMLNPNRADYDNRKEYFWLVQSLNVLYNYFGIVQIRTALLALFELKENGLLSLSDFKSVITFLEGFHFAYNAVLSRKANTFEKIYSSFAIEARRCTDKAAVKEVINKKLYSPINKTFPSFIDFAEGFSMLTFSKKDNISNTKTKYTINKINTLFSGHELFEENGSIEHILPESQSDNIGNLILLEQSLNNEAGEKPYLEKKEFYRKSDYKWVSEFVESNENFSSDNIQKRAMELAKLYYTKVLGRNIDDIK